MSVEWIGKVRTYCKTNKGSTPIVLITNILVRKDTKKYAYTHERQPIYDLSP